MADPKPADPTNSGLEQDLQKLEGTKDRNWVWTGSSIDGARWHKQYPYQLLLLQAGDNGYESWAPSGSGSVQVQALSFTLPIPPQALSINTPFAINNAFTLGGVIEEHNGAPLRLIQIQGTTGVLPTAGRDPGTNGPADRTGGFFAGTERAIGNVGSVAKAVINDQNQPRVSGGYGSYGDNGVVKDGLGSKSGYYQFRVLQQFLEGYVNLKKAGNADLRLGLAIWKDEAVYLVTPLDFTLTRAVDSPLEYRYSLNLRAWKRVQVDVGGVAIQAKGPTVVDRALAKRVAGKIQQARNLIAAAARVPGAVRGDIQENILNQVRMVGLGLKEAAGLALAVADLPLDLARDVNDLVLELIDDVEGIAGIPQVIRDRYKKFKIRTGRPGPGQAQDPGQPWQAREAAVDTGDDGSWLKTLADSERDQLLQALPLDRVLARAPASFSDRVEILKEQARDLTRTDYEAIRDQLQGYTQALADSVGAGSADFNSFYGLPAPVSSLGRDPQDTDFDTLWALNDLILEFNRLAASGVPAVDTSYRTYEYLAGAGSALGTAFQSPVSKFSVPFPYGHTLEQVAARYLGNGQRWVEIAALNGLQNPYVDEVGFSLPLLTRGSGNQVQVGDATNLYPGQALWLESNNSRRTKRKLLAVERVGSNYVLTVSGDSDCDRYQPIANASLHAFLPNTINSTQLIYIPSADPVDDTDFRVREIPGIDSLDPLIRVGGVDLLLTQAGDLALTEDGDVPLAQGLTALTQKIRVALATAKGGLWLYPNYGFGLTPGQSTADTGVDAIQKALQDLVAQDPAFTGVYNVKITKSGPGLSLSFAVAVAGVDQLVPVSMNLQ